VHDVVELLRALEPFTELDESALAELAGRTEVEFFGAGEIIFRQGEPGLRHVRDDGVTDRAPPGLSSCGRAG
jgi:signal-transduction protein with cAMP-binding, CBS, and nucleotidyltransferase domain